MEAIRMSVQKSISNSSWQWSKENVQCLLQKAWSIVSHLCMYSNTPTSLQDLMLEHLIPACKLIGNARNPTLINNVKYFPYGFVLVQKSQRGTCLFGVVKHSAIFFHCPHEKLDKNKHSVVDQKNELFEPPTRFKGMLARQILFVYDL